MEIKQHTSKQPTGQSLNQKTNKTYLETNENGNTKYQNLWDAAKVILREKFIAINACIMKQERSEINNLTLYLKELNKKEQSPRLAEERR